jgi:hypothetical protein
MLVKQAQLLLLSLLLALAFLAPSANAQVPETVWLRERPLLVEKHDGTEARGWLVANEADLVRILRADGQVTTLRKEEIRSVRPLAAAARTLMPPLVPSPAPPSSSELRFAIQVTPVLELPELLRRRSAELASLDADEKRALLASFRASDWGRGAGLFLNALVLPGLGSIVQGDIGFGYPLAGSSVLGLGLLGAGFALNVNTHGSGLVIAGGSLLLLSWIIGIVRPFVYEDVRHRILREELAHLGTRVGARIEPALIAEPVGLSDGPPGRQLVGAGVRGSF